MSLPKLPILVISMHPKLPRMLDKALGPVSELSSAKSASAGIEKLESAEAEGRPVQLLFVNGDDPSIKEETSEQYRLIMLWLSTNQAKKPWVALVTVQEGVKKPSWVDHICYLGDGPKNSDRLKETIILFGKERYGRQP